MNKIKRIVTVSCFVFALLWGGWVDRADAAVIVDYNPTNTSHTSKWQIGGQYSYPTANGQIGFFGGEYYNPTNGQQMGRNGHQIGYLLKDDPTNTWSIATPQRMATIESIRIIGTDSPTSRSGLEQITVYYGNGESQVITMPATPGDQTYTFSPPIVSSYIYWTVPNDTTGKYVSESGFGGSPDTPFYRFIVEGTWGDVLTNLNAAATLTSTGDVTFGSIDRLTNGTTYVEGAGNGVFWQRNATNPDGVTATYGSAQVIASIGIGLNLDDVRPQPAEITLSYNSGSEVITLRGDNLSYGMYDLVAPVTSTFLTITFPDGTATNGWFHTSGAGDNWGLTEFQAFGVSASGSSPPAAIPTLSEWGMIFMFGGLMFLTWRRLSGRPQRATAAVEA